MCIVQRCTGKSVSVCDHPVAESASESTKKWRWSGMGWSGIDRCTADVDQLRASIPDHPIPADVDQLFAKNRDGMAGPGRDGGSR
jgi:hypothetical protein